jgi:hypothetical protein
MLGHNQRCWPAFIQRSNSTLPRRTTRSDLSPLPRPLTSFVGRERELAEIKHLLASTRLLTLVGPGASAKPAWLCI